jgi:hypothetical protein
MEIHHLYHHLKVLTVEQKLISLEGEVAEAEPLAQMGQTVKPFHNLQTHHLMD